MTKQPEKPRHNKYVTWIGVISMALVGVVSLFYERFFPFVFIIAALISFIRTLDSVRMKAYKSASQHTLIMLIFIVGAFIIIWKTR